MTRLFVMLPEFEKQWNKMGLTDDDLRRLQYELLADPQKGDVMQGTGGLILITNKTVDKKSSHNPYMQDYARFFVQFLIGS